MAHYDAAELGRGSDSRSIMQKVVLAPSKCASRTRLMCHLLRARAKTRRRASPAPRLFCDETRAAPSNNHHIPDRFMHARALVSRTSCSAQNAYNSASALRTAFVAPLRCNAAGPSQTSTWHACGANLRRPSLNLARYSSTAVSSEPPITKIYHDDLRNSRSDIIPTDDLTLSAAATSRNIAKAVEATDSSTPVSESPLTQGPFPGTRLPVPHVHYFEREPSARREFDPALSWQKEMQKIAEAAGRMASREWSMRTSPQRVDNSQQKPNILDYNPFEIPPRRAPRNLSIRPPWAPDYINTKGRNSDDLLAYEIARFVEYWELTPMEMAARKAVTVSVLNILGNTTPLARLPVNHNGLQVFGSDRSGLASPNSDIDISVRKLRTMNEADVEQIFEVTYANLFRDERFMCVTKRKAKYLMINAQHIQTGIHVQIVAAPSAAPQDFFAKNIIKQIPNLRELYFLLHTGLSMRGLIDVWNGGIGSYGLLNMLVAALTRPSSAPAETIAEQLRRFLDFYTQLDTTKYGVTALPGGLFKKHDGQPRVSTRQLASAAWRRGDAVRAGQWSIAQRRRFQPYLLCLQDPTSPTNDLGRKTNAIKHLLVTLGGIRDELERNRGRGAEVYNPANGAPGSFLGHLLGRCDLFHADRRARMEAFGAVPPEVRARHLVKMKRLRLDESQKPAEEKMPSDSQAAEEPKTTEKETASENGPTEEPKPTEMETASENQATKEPKPTEAAEK